MKPPRKETVSGCPHHNKQSKADRLYAWLDAPVHASSLGLFRFVYGFIMIAQILRWWPIFEEFKGSIHMVPHAGLGFIKPVHPDTGHLILQICLVSSLMLALGLFTRGAGAVAFVTFAYLFHICVSLYNNHYILMCHVNFVGSFLDWGRWCSLDSWLFKKKVKGSSPCVPYWNLLLMQLLFTIPYFFGSIAKMNHDWLFRAQPVTLWFSKNNEWIFQQFWFPWIISWGGMLYDASISFLLFWKKTRYIIGFPAALFFNLSNKYIFNIGVFPYAMICSLVLFMDPHTPAVVWKALMGLPPPILPPLERPILPRSDEHASERRNWRKWFVLTFVGSFIVFHALFPLRHFVLYKSTPSWTEEGHMGAWHMKLRSKSGFIYLRARGQDGTLRHLIPKFDPFITKKQLDKVYTWPHAMSMYLTRINLVFDEANQPLESLTVESCFSLNANPEKKLFIPSANMLEYLGKYELIGTTAIGKFLYGYEEAPYCDRTADPARKPGMNMAAKETYLELYRNANFSSDTIITFYGKQMRRVTHESRNGLIEFGYMWRKWDY